MARTKEKQESYSDQVHARAAAASRRTAAVTSGGGAKPWTRDSIISAVLGGANLALAINQIARGQSDGWTIVAAALALIFYCELWAKGY
jgi:hypothetical protein